MKRMIMLLVLCLSSFALSACEELEELIYAAEEVLQEADSNQAEQHTEKFKPRDVDGNLHVHFIDVDQGDATYFEGENFSLLIDAGRHNANDVVPYLKSIGVEDIDIVIGTHPHSDHIGQIDQVLYEFNVDEVWMSGDEHTSQNYERVIDAIEETGVGYNEPRAHEEYVIGDLDIDVIHPEELGNNLDDNSVSVKATYGDVSFILTGDAGTQAEDEMIARGYDLDAEILQLGHHGSSTSTGQNFLDAVDPDIAIYSASENNQYGHPHDEVVERVEAMGIDLYGTAERGTIIVSTDGTGYEVETER